MNQLEESLRKSLVAEAFCAQCGTGGPCAHSQSGDTYQAPAPPLPGAEYEHVLTKHGYEQVSGRPHNSWGPKDWHHLESGSSVAIRRNRGTCHPVGWTHYCDGEELDNGNDHEELDGYLGEFHKNI